MPRRVLIALLLAGCASSQSSKPGPVAPAPVAPPPPPAAAAPPAAPIPANTMAFDAWLADFRPRALAAGVSATVLERELSGLTPDDRVSSLDGRQPEFSRPISAYLKGTVTQDRITLGQQRRADVAAFSAIEQRYGVPREILIGIWAMESGFGKIQGDYDVVRSMATLAADGRRRGFAEDQLIAVLRIIQSGEFPRSRLRGSWAGAMGQTQFIPTTFATTAVDFDGDGRRDIWTSAPDALASAANLLDKGGWRPGESWAREVTVPARFDYGLTEGPRETPDWWANLGVKRADGLPWTAADRAAPAMLVAPTGAGGPLFLLFPNHFAIRKYNNSLAYALGVGMLADRISGVGELVKAWPDETPLSLADRMAAQKALTALGFDTGTPDGVVGTNTRTALRAWQKARGLTADGYLSMDMVRRLRAEAGVA